MNKFNRRFNARLVRYKRWQEIRHKLCEFEGIVNDYAHATPDEVKDLKKIYEKLYEMYITAKRYEEDLRPYD